MPSPRAVFRCDASPSIGGGHVSRCLALAEALHEFGWEIHFVVTQETLTTTPALAGSCYHIRPLATATCDLQAVGAAAMPKADLLVLDHYDRDYQFERACRPLASKILAFDDGTGRDHDCDILVDSGAVDAASYAGHVPSHAVVLVGPAYGLVRRSFVQHRETALARHDGRPVQSILVSCGATDPINCTQTVVEALANLADNIAITIVLSSRAPHLGAVRSLLGARMRLLIDVDAEQMAELMTKADFAIGAPSVSAFERAALGLPSITIILTDNQRSVSRLLSYAGATVDAGTSDDGLIGRLQRLLKSALEDNEMRRRLANAASAMIDGRGALRIILAMHSETSIRGVEIRLRLAAAADEAWLLWLQGRSETRRYFRNPAVPAAAEHHAWMRRVLSNPKTMLLIVEADHDPVGMMRLDGPANTPNGPSFEISIAVDPAHHAQGVASAALRLVRKLLPNGILDATIHSNNAASKALFRAAGFKELSVELHRSMPA